MTRDWRELLRLRRLIARRLFLARLSLGLERLTSSLWLAFIVIGVFCVVALFDVLPSLPSLLHGLSLALLAIGLFLTLRAGFSEFSWPTAMEARHRLETGSGTSHRPLTAWEDNLGYKADAGQNKLWLAHRLRMRNLIEKLKAPWPAALIARRDQFSLRGALLLLIFVGVLGAQGDIGPRFVRAVNPVLAADTGPVDVKVWLTPPTYTGRPPVLLDPSEEDSVDLATTTPAGTQALVVVTGTNRSTRMIVDDTSVDLSLTDDSSQRYEGPLPTGTLLEIRQTGKTLASWQLNPVADNPPSIVLSAAPEETGRNRLRLKYSAEDDYGITAVSGRIDRPGETRAYAKGWAFDFPISIPPLSETSFDHQSFHDFAAHPWAGKDVTLKLTATDAANQQAESETISFRLPERRFSHLVAATIIQYRKDLIEDPSTAPLAARALSRLIEVPAGYGGDIVAHLAMASARSRLDLQDATEVLDSVIDLMWRAAVRMEDGGLAVAEQALADAEEALSEALENDASPEEINRLVSRLQRALMEYYQALAEQMPDGSFPMTNANGDLQTMGSEDLAQMMEQLRQLSEMGAADAAKQMMTDLSGMLEMLRNAALNPMSHPDIEAAKQMMDELKEITEDQSDLLNQSFEEARQQALDRNQMSQMDRERSNDDPGNQSDNTSDSSTDSSSDEAQKGDDAAEAQEQLRQRLGDLVGRMAEMTGQVPEGLAESDQAMRDAEQALRDQSWRPASDAQAQALAGLQSGMQGAAQQMMQALAEQGLAGLIPMPGQAGQPLGSLGPNLGPDQGEEVELPSEPDTRGLSQRSREILEEIRRRAGQRLRSSEERQYLRRLLEQF